MASDDTPEPTETTQEPTLAVQLARALRACQPHERKWLRALPEHDFYPYRAAVALGMSKNTAFKCLRRPRVRKVIEILDLMAADELGITARLVKTTYHRLATSDPRLFYDAEGNVKPPSQWTNEMAAAVAEYGPDANGVIRLKLHDRKVATDALAKFCKLAAPDRVEVTGKDGSPLPTGPTYIIAREEAEQIQQGLDEKF